MIKIDETGSNIGRRTANEKISPDYAIDSSRNRAKNAGRGNECASIPATKIGLAVAAWYKRCHAPAASLPVICRWYSSARDRVDSDKENCHSHSFDRRAPTFFEHPNIHRRMCMNQQPAATQMTLSAQEIEQFKHDGYLLLRNMAPPAMCETMLAITEAHLRGAVPPLEYEADVGYPGAPASFDAPGGKTVRRLRDAYHRDPVFLQWAQDAHLVARLAQLFGEDVCLPLAHHNCVMTKHPDFGTATGWHRDIRYWSFTRPDLISVWLALGAENAANGGLKFIPGSHRMQIQPAQLDALDFLQPDSPDNQALFDQGITLALQQGDVVFFHSGLFHAAGKNTTASIKASVVFAYHGISTKPVEGTKSAAAEDILLARL
jgi:phytanoyl-CoA hydroxylase